MDYKFTVHSPLAMLYTLIAWAKDQRDEVGPASFTVHTPEGWFGSCYGPELRDLVLQAVHEHAEATVYGFEA